MDINFNIISVYLLILILIIDIILKLFYLVVLNIYAILADDLSYIYVYIVINISNCNYMSN